MSLAAGRAARLREHVAAVAVLVALSLVAYGALLVKPDLLATAHSDIVTFHLGVKETLVRSLRAGHGIPFWSDRQLGGAPAFVDPQSQYTFPLHAFFFFLPTASALAWSMWLELVVAGLGAYALGAVLELGLGARLAMGAAELLGFKLVLAAYAGWLAYLGTIALVPWLVAAVLVALKRPGPGAAAGVALAGALCLHSGMMQLVYYASLFLAALVVVEGVAARREGRGRAYLGALGWLAAGGALAVGLSAYLLVPLASELPLYARGRISYDELVAPGTTTATTLLSFVVPELEGSPLDHAHAGVELWEKAAYFGAAPLALAALGVVARSRERFVRLLAGAFLVALALSADGAPLRAAYHLLPGMGLFRIPVRLLFLTALFGVVLAGYGLDALLARAKRAGLSPRAQGLVALAALAVVAGEGLLWTRRYLHAPGPHKLVPRTSYAEAIGKDGGRTASLVRGSVNYGWAASMGLELVGGYDPLTLRRTKVYVDLLTRGRYEAELPSVENWTDLERIARPDLLDALDVTHVVAPEAVRVDVPTIERTAVLPREPIFVFYEGLGRGPLALYASRGALGRAFFVDRVASASSEADAAAKVLAGDLRRVAVVEGPPELARDEPPRGDGDSVRVTEQRDGVLALQVRADADRLLVVSEIAHPGWRATVDGASAALWPADVALMALRVPKGEHEVRIEHRPLHLAPSLAASGVCAVAVMGLAVAAAMRARRSRAR